MSQDAAPGRIEVRTSVNEVVIGVVACIALLSGLSFCSSFDSEPPAASEGLWLIVGLALVIGLVVVARTLANRSPRIILDASGIFWREGSSRIYETLAWPEIVSATIEPGGEDEVRRLRLHLKPLPALERVASEGPRRWVDISLDTVDIHERRLRRVINQLASHLFPGAARDRIDLAAT